MATGAARLRAEVTGQTAAGNESKCWTESATVYSVTDGYDPDNMYDPTVTITWRDTEVPASYVATYTPQAGDVVLVLVQTPKPPIVLGRIIGPAKEA